MTNDVHQVVKSLRMAVEAAFAGSAEHGSFFRSGVQGEWTPSVFMTLNQLDDALIAMRERAEKAEAEVEALKSEMAGVKANWELDQRVLNRLRGARRRCESRSPHPPESRCEFSVGHVGPHIFGELAWTDASPSAPSGWQQRIAAAYQAGWDHAQTSRSGWTDEPLDDGIKRYVAGLTKSIGQNAKDALPPAPEAPDFIGAAVHEEADASPAKDPIAAAVDAQLDPLKDELTAIGHKLAKGDAASSGVSLATWTHSCYSCGGFGGHEANCPGCFCKSCWSLGQQR